MICGLTLGVICVCCYQHAEDIQPYLLSLLKGLPKVQWVVPALPSNVPGMYFSVCATSIARGRFKDDGVGHISSYSTFGSFSTKMAGECLTETSCLNSRLYAKIIVLCEISCDPYLDVYLPCIFANFIVGLFEFRYLYNVIFEARYCHAYVKVPLNPNQPIETLPCTVTVSYTHLTLPTILRV